MFIPSQHSTRNSRFSHSFGAASFMEAAGRVQPAIVVSDGKASFGVRSDGQIEVLTNEYGNKGQVFNPGSALYDQVIKNLSAVPGNADKIKNAIGVTKFTESISSPPIVAPSADPMKDTMAKVPLWQKPWFPMAAGATVLGAGVLLLVFQPWK